MIDGYYDDVAPPTKEELKLFAKYQPEPIEQYKRLYKTDRFLLGRHAVEFWKELALRPTCTISCLSAGWEGHGSKIVIGKEGIAKVDLRLVPNQKVEKVKKLLRGHLDEHRFPDIEMRLLSGYEPSRTSIDHPFIQSLSNLIKDFSGKEAILIPPS